MLELRKTSCYALPVKSPEMPAKGDITLSAQEGFKPLPLPRKGEDLEQGRQYMLSPLARLIIDEVFGYRGVPTYVECLRKKVARTRITTTTENLETGEVKTSSMELEAQVETFRAFMAYKRVLKFSIDLERLHSSEGIYANSPKLKFYEMTCEYQAKLKARGQGPKRERRNGVSESKIQKIDLSLLGLKK